ncbi:MAG: ATPase domain-containing protein [Thermoplasmata archaeon]
MVSRIKTYVGGYDENLGGGIPEGHAVLLAGAPGTMKSSLAYSILYNNSKREGRRTLFISLEQSKDSLEDQMESLQMERKEVKDALAILDLATMRIKIGNLRGETMMNMLKMYVENIRRSFDYDLLVLDSLDALQVLADFEDFKMEYFKLFKWLRGLDVTSILISELPYPSPDVGFHFDDLKGDKKSFLADGIIHLTMDQTSLIETQRRIRCVKMRGTEHETGYFMFEFDSGNFSATRAVS